MKMSGKTFLIWPLIPNPKTMGLLAVGGKQKILELSQEEVVSIDFI